MRPRPGQSCIDRCRGHASGDHSAKMRRLLRAELLQVVTPTWARASFGRLSGHVIEHQAKSISATAPACTTEYKDASATKGSVCWTPPARRPRRSAKAPACRTSTSATPTWARARSTPRARRRPRPSATAPACRTSTSATPTWARARSTPRARRRPRPRATARARRINTRASGQPTRQGSVCRTPSARRPRRSATAPASRASVKALPASMTPKRAPATAARLVCVSGTTCAGGGDVLYDEVQNLFKTTRLALFIITNNIHDYSH